MVRFTVVAPNGMQISSRVKGLTFVSGPNIRYLYTILRLAIIKPTTPVRPEMETTGNAHAQV